MCKKVRGRDKFSRFKKQILLLSKVISFLPIKIRSKLLEHYRMTLGTKGFVIRYTLLKSVAKECGDNIAIYSGVYLLNPENLIIGNNVSVHPMCYIDATGEIIIGNDVSIAHGTTILSTTHNFNNLNVTTKDQGICMKKTVISDNVWIGAKATILYGVNIESGAIIGANTVISRDVLSNSVMVGSKAIRIKVRN